jgi:hypothetical protein
MSFLAPIAGAVLGGVIGADSARKATHAQQDEARAANELQKYMYDTNRADTAPYREAGSNALSQIQALLKNPSSVAKQPDYQFGLNQGSKALQNSATARGMTYSGQQAKALQRYGNDYAGSKLDQTYNRLAQVAGIGQSGVNGSALVGGNYANNAGQNMIGIGNAGAVNALARGSAYGNALNQTSAYGDRNNWWGGSGGANGASFGGPLDSFFAGTGGSGD